MIKYALVCGKGHDFESWFRDSDSFDTQARRGLVACPLCDNTRVSKAIMAPAVTGARKAMAPAAVEIGASEAAAPTPIAAPMPGPVTLLDERHQRLRAMIREMRTEIVAKSDDVGRSFPETARKIHYGEAPPRSIRGEASGAEVKELLEEGIGVLPMPSLPEERN